MDVVTLIVDAVIVMWVLAVITGVVRAIRARPARLAPGPQPREAAANGRREIA
jgi:hypothetical protein